MPQMPSNLELVKAILENEEEKTLEEEEIIHLLLERKVSRNTSETEGERALGARLADGIARFVGSWTFISIFMACLAAWILLNLLLSVRAFDPYPFILLNLALSCVAAIQAPVIMMSQNRQEEKDRLRSLNDYRTNLKSEIIVEDLHRKIDQLLANQDELLSRIAQLEKDERKA